MNIAQTLQVLKRAETDMFTRHHLEDASSIASSSTAPIEEYCTLINSCLDRAVERNPELNQALAEVRSTLQGYIEQGEALHPNKD